MRSGNSPRRIAAVSEYLLSSAAVVRKDIVSAEERRRSRICSHFMEASEGLMESLLLQHFMDAIGLACQAELASRSRITRLESTEWEAMLIQARAELDIVEDYAAIWNIERLERCSRVDVYAEENSERVRLRAALLLGFGSTRGVERGRVCAAESAAREGVIMSEALSRRSLARYLAGIVATITLQPWEETEAIRRAAVEREWSRGWRALKVTIFGLLLHLAQDSESYNRRTIEYRQSRCFDVIEAQTALDMLELKVVPARRVIEVAEMKGRQTVFECMLRAVALRCQSKVSILRNVLCNTEGVSGVAACVREGRPLFAPPSQPLSWFPEGALAMMPRPELMARFHCNLKARPRAFSIASDFSLRSKRSTVARKQMLDGTRGAPRATSRGGFTALAAAGERRMKSRGTHRHHRGASGGSEGGGSHVTARTARGGGAKSTIGGLSYIGERRRRRDRDGVSVHGNREVRVRTKPLGVGTSFRSRKGDGALDEALRACDPFASASGRKLSRHRRSSVTGTERGSRVSRVSRA